MLKVGVIGCGKMADNHFYQINKISTCQLAGVCDSELLMAKQAAVRAKIEAYYDNVDVFLDAVRPDVVHITTPPQSHYELAMKCIDRGAHIYVEKPFAMDFRETDEVLRAVSLKGLKVTVGHNAQFSLAMNHMRKKVSCGYLGGKPIHLESYYCYNIKNKRYVQALLGDENH